jgi:hypothetical protein
MLRRWFAPSVFLASDTVEAAARAYEQAADGDDATVRYNADTARTAIATGGRSFKMPGRDFIVASDRMRLDDNEPVYVTACWRRAADLESCGATITGEQVGDAQWVEQRSLRFGDPLDPPENIMVVEQPSICQKPYMCVVLLRRPAACCVLRAACCALRAVVLEHWAALTDGSGIPQARVVLRDGADASRAVAHPPDRARRGAASRALAHTSTSS